jgi:Zn-dependent peptidase ImmA (M78 family)
MAVSLSPVFYARQLRHELKLTGAVDLSLVADRMNIKIFEEALDAEGYLIQKGKEARIIINNNIGYETRKCFTIAHELGHFYMPHHQESIFRCLARDIQSYCSDRKLEYEANEFAGEFLLPAQELEKRLLQPPNLDMIKKLSEIYGASLTATAVKVVQLTCEKIAVVLSESGKIKWICKSESFPYWINKGPLHEWTYAYDFFTAGKSLPETPQKVQAMAWCQGVSREELIFEESMAFPNLNIVMTLLYIPYEEEFDAFY